MSGFDSPAFRKKIASSNQRLNEYTVGDESDFSVYEEEQELDVQGKIKKARTEKENELNKISEHAKKRIELLSNIGRLTKEVKINNFVFSLRTLKAKETKEAMLNALNKSKTEVEMSYELRNQYLARALYKIDGVDVEQIIGSNLIDDKIINLIDNLEDVVLEKLSNEYELLKSDAQKQTILNEENLKEVVEDLKK